jgi:hypothetical protein
LSAAIDLRFLTEQGFWTALGSVATAAAVVVALTALSLERRARRQEERVAQARKISAWVERVDFSGSGTAIALNASDGPVYRFVAFLVLAQGAGPHTGEEVAVRDDDLAHPGARLVLPPGQHTVELPRWPGRDMHRRPGVEIAFTDVRGQHWIRRVDGRLEEIKTDAVQHYHLPMPGTW